MGREGKEVISAVGVVLSWRLDRWVQGVQGCRCADEVA